MTPDEVQLDLIRAALGIRYEEQRLPYRNRFYAPAIGHPNWEALEKAGYAKSDLLKNKQRLYRVTWKGMRAVGLRKGSELRGLEGEELVDVPLLVKWRGRLK